MSNYLEMETHRRSYLPICAWNIMITIFSVFLALRMVDLMYTAEFSTPVVRQTLWVMGCSCAVIIFHSNFMITGGRAIWLKISVGILVMCVVTVLPAVAYKLGPLVYIGAIFLPVLGLISFGSHLQQKFHKEFLEFRQQRFISFQHDRRGPGDRGLAQKRKVRRKAKALKDESTAHGGRNAQMARVSLGRSFLIVVVKLGGSACATFCLAMIGGGCHLIYKGFVTGVVVGSSRRGPLPRYSFDDAPWMYGSSMFMLFFGLGLFTLILRLLVLLYKSEVEE